MKECPKCELCFSDDVNFCPHDKTQTRASLPGDKLLVNRYLLEKRIGRGAMGQVYLAKDQNLGTRRVAVKTVRQDILSSEDLQEGEAIVRFEREAMSAASISHPHVVDVTDFGKTADGVFFLVMEYVEGETLHRLLRREGTLPVKRAVKLLRQIADGVEAAHDAGILHRDLKPANMVMQELRRHRIRQNEERLKLGASWHQNDFVFPSEIGTPLNPPNVTRHFKRILKKAEIRTSIRLYDLRHTTATLLLQAGINPKIVSERLGHATIVLTLDTYSHVLPNMQRDATDQLEQMIFRKNGTL